MHLRSFTLGAMAVRIPRCRQTDCVGVDVRVDHRGTAGEDGLLVTDRRSERAVGRARVGRLEGLGSDVGHRGLLAVSDV